MGGELRGFERSVRGGVVFRVQGSIRERCGCKVRETKEDWPGKSPFGLWLGRHSARTVQKQVRAVQGHAIIKTASATETRRERGPQVESAGDM